MGVGSGLAGVFRLTSSWAFGRCLRCATVPTDASPIRQNLLQQQLVTTQQHCCHSNTNDVATAPRALQASSGTFRAHCTGSCGCGCRPLHCTRRHSPVRSAAFAPLQAAELGDVASQFFAGYLYGLHALPNHCCAEPNGCSTHHGCTASFVNQQHVARRATLHVARSFLAGCTQARPAKPMCRVRCSCSTPRRRTCVCLRIRAQCNAAAALPLTAADSVG